MKLSNIKAFAKVAKATIIKHSPEILMGLGAATFIGTVIVTAKETIKEEDILADHNDELVDLTYNHEVGDLDDKAYKKSRRNVYFDTAKRTAVNYIPAAALGVTSLACFFGAFGIMRKRYATLVVYTTALEESFRKYRERVIADKGADADLYYLTGSKVKEVTKKDEDGNKTKQKELLILPDGTVASPYAFKFGKYKENGERNLQWKGNSILDMAYIMGQQDYLNDQLSYHRVVFDDKHRVVVRGWVFLNEARELLGESGTTSGSVVGWRTSNGEPGCNGYIDFRVTEATEIDPETGEEINCMFINPNVDGLIYDLIGKKEPKPFDLPYNVYDF